MLKRLLIILLLPGIFFTFAHQTFAASFATDYNVTYSIDGNANTRVNLNVVVSNLTDQYYTPTYEIQAGFKNIKNLTVSDELGKINPAVTAGDKGTVIKVSFNEKSVGFGNKHTLNIAFDTDEVAKNLNHIWEINIPGLSANSDFSSFNASVVYPLLLGKPSFIKPDITPKYGNLSNVLSFTKNDLGASGISITFGNYQIYGFDLSYHLENSNLFPVKTEIALPADNNYQDVIIDSINPKPVNVTPDKDGNWLAEYHLSASQKINIEVIGKSKLKLIPSQENITAEQISEYLQPQTYWEVNSQKIKDLAMQLKTPKEIYNFTVNNLNYDYSLISSDKKRLGAVGALQNPTQAVCLEFTDLFIAIARAAGIPAREVDGFANTQNTKERPLSLIKDILHAWPEYYDFDKKTWVMIDPTWGNTTGGVDYFNTLDFDHFAFVIKGLSSTYPVPAGGYKLPQNIDAKDVNVNIENAFVPVAKLIPGIRVNDVTFAGFPVDVAINIINSGNSISKDSGILISSNFFNPAEQTVYFPKIPPFGSTTVNVRYLNRDFLTNTKSEVKITFENNNYTKLITILPIFLYKWVVLGGLIFVGALIISIIIARSRRLLIPK
jgi:hypothetical protein